MSVTAQAIDRWCATDQEPTLTRAQADYAFHALGPRNRFIKTLPLGASLLDAGAGDGSLSVLSVWPDPPRSDLRLHAWAGDKGENFDLYQAFEVGYWPEFIPDFGGKAFEAVFSANFLEHIDDPLRFVEWAVSRLAPGGRIYLEWPHPQSQTLPTTAELAMHGVNVFTGRYDATHRPKVPDAGAIRQALLDLKLQVREQGIVSVPFVDQQLAINARLEGDVSGLTIAYWSHTGWCQYLVAEAAADSAGIERLPRDG